MNNYFDELQPIFQKKLKPLAETRDSLRKQTVALRKKIEDTQNLIERLVSHAVKLEVIAGESLLGGPNEYSKFQTSLRKNVVEQETAKRELSGLRSALEQTMKTVTLAERKLNDKIKLLARDNLPLAQKRIDALLNQICEEHDSWIDAWTELCSQHGESFACGRQGLVPSVRHKRINYKLAMVHFLPVEERLERLKKQKE